MRHSQLKHCFVFCASTLLFPVLAAAQAVETVGSRALGMGGAFVAVASDSSATWWNPAGLAAGPFLDVALARAITDRGEPPARDAATWFALGTPPFGFSYYRLRIADIGPADPTVTESGNREEEGTGVARTLAATQVGITLVQTLIPGLHAGATLKYLRGGLEEGPSEGAFDVDIGLLGVAGPLRAGVLVRNVREPELGDAGRSVRLDRQVRAGAAIDAGAVGGPPLVVALDLDLRRTQTAGGARRNVAIGVEHWVLPQRLAVRGGARLSTVGATQRAATAGASVAVRAGLFVDGHVVRGSAADDRGWGLAARVHF